MWEVPGQVPGQVPGPEGQQLHLLRGGPGGQLSPLSHLSGAGSLSSRNYRLFTSQGETVRRLQQDFFRLDERELVCHCDNESLSVSP